MLTELDKVATGNEKAELELKELRLLLTWILYNHQGGKSPIGQAVRKMLGISQFQQLTDEQISDSRKVVHDAYYQQETDDGN